MNPNCLQIVLPTVDVFAIAVRNCDQSHLPNSVAAIVIHCNSAQAVTIKPERRDSSCSFTTLFQLLKACQQISIPPNSLESTIGYVTRTYSPLAPHRASVHTSSSSSLSGREKTIEAAVSTSQERQRFAFLLPHVDRESDKTGYLQIAHTPPHTPFFSLLCLLVFVVLVGLANRASCLQSHCLSNKRK